MVLEIEMGFFAKDRKIHGERSMWSSAQRQEKCYGLAADGWIE